MTTRIETDVEQSARDQSEGSNWRVAHRQETSLDVPTAVRLYGMPCAPGLLSASRGPTQSRRVREVKQ